MRGYPLKLDGRKSSSNIEDRTDSNLASNIIKSMKRDTGDSDNAWDYMMSPKPISAKSNKFEKNMNTSLNYSFQGKGK